MRLALSTIVIAALAVGGVADAGKRAGKIEKIEHVPSEMVFVPSGTFEMGVSGDEVVRLMQACKKQLAPVSTTLPCDALPAYLGGGSIGAPQGTVKIISQYGRVMSIKPTARTVFVAGFWIDRYEVTARDYRKCVAAGACDVAPLVENDPRYIASAKPMVNITWSESAAYCEWRGKRLPTEAEWEKAARGNDGRRFPWGNHQRADGANHGKLDATGAAIRRSASLIFAPDDADGQEYAHAPGSMKWTGGPYGTYDQAGNVAEWVQDYFDKDGYDELPKIDPVRSIARPGERMRVVRGGSWLRPKFMARTYFRSQARPDSRAEDRGFRCARPAK